MTQEFKIGDRVEITGNTNHSINKIGDIGFITDVNDSTGNCQVQVQSRSSSCNWTKPTEMKLVSTDTSDNPMIREITETSILDKEFISDSRYGSARVSISPKGYGGSLNLVVGARRSDQLSSAFSKMTLTTLIEDLTQVRDLMED